MKIIVLPTPLQLERQKYIFLRCLKVLNTLP